MAQNNLWLNLEDWRLQQHFKRVLKHLRKQNISHLPSQIQQARKTQLERLESYAERGIFPRNHSANPYTPCFIDSERRECAVAHLLIQSGESQLAEKIAGQLNEAYVPQMRFPELGAWAAEAGLSKEELTQIQPGYWASFWDFALFALGFWFFGLSSILFNALQILNKRPAHILAFLMSLPLLCGGLFLLLLGLLASGLSRDREVPELYRIAAGNDAYGLFWGAMFTLALGLIIIAMVSYRRRAFKPAKIKNSVVQRRFRTR